VFYHTKKTDIKCPGLGRRQIFLTIFARTGIWTYYKPHGSNLQPYNMILSYPILHCFILYK